MMSLNLPLSDPAGIFSLVLVVILLAPFIAEKLKLPAVVGLALAGVLIGPHVLGLLAKDSAIEFLGTIGLMYVFFMAGAEIDLALLQRESRSTLAFFAFTFGLPFAVGFATGSLFFSLGTLSAILFGCLFSSYTLVPYPIVSKLGLTRQRSVIVAVSAVILTDTTTMGLLAAVARISRGEASFLGWAKMLGVLVLWGLLVALLLPKIAELFFRKVKPDGTIEFVFTIAMVFICAYTSKLAGLEPIIGAFIAGLLLNRFIPESGVLMNRVKFAGNALFIPFFMVYIGVLADPTFLFSSWTAFGMAAAMVVLNIISKALAAVGAGSVLGYRKDERIMLFGLSVNHAAAVLAAALVGFKLGLFDQTVLNGAIFLILASCFIGPLATENAGKRLAAACDDRQIKSDRSPERILVALSNPSTVHDLVSLSFLLRSRRSEEPVYPLVVVPESANTRVEIAKAENNLAQAVVQGVSAGVPIIPSTRISVNASEGIVQAAMENRAGVLVLGWDRSPKISQAFFGSEIEQVVEGASELVIVARIPKPLSSVSHLSIIVPPMVERHPGFHKGLGYLGNLVTHTGARCTFYIQKPGGQALAEVLASTKHKFHSQIVEVESWRAFSHYANSSSSAGDFYVFFSARPGEAAWHPAAEKLPHRIGEERPGDPLLLFYLPDGSIEDQEVAEKSGKAAVQQGLGMDLYEKAREAGRLRPRMRESSINDAVRELLRSHYDSDRKTLAKLAAIFTEIAQKQPIELEPGVLLLHAHVAEAGEPLVFFGYSQEGIRLLSLEEPARLLVLLCAPSDLSPEEHLRTLGEIVRLVKNGKIGDRLRQEP